MKRSHGTDFWEFHGDKFSETWAYEVSNLKAIGSLFAEKASKMPSLGGKIVEFVIRAFVTGILQGYTWSHQN